jgi:hypothetical protein
MFVSLIVLAVAAAGCSSGSGTGAGAGSASASAAASNAISAPCIKPGTAQARHIVHYPSSGGVRVEAYLSSPAAGTHVSPSGTVGIVIVHQSLQTLCETMRWAVVFAGAGYLALAPTVGDNQQVAEVEASVAYLRGHGATQVVLLGGSIGGTRAPGRRRTDAAGAGRGQPLRPERLLSDERPADRAEARGPGVLFGRGEGH